MAWTWDDIQPAAYHCLAVLHPHIDGRRGSDDDHPQLGNILGGLMQRFLHIVDHSQDVPLLAAASSQERLGTITYCKRKLACRGIQ